MGDYMQEKGLDEGFNLVCVWQEYSLEETSIIWVLLLQWEWSKILVTLAILYFFLVHIKSFNAINVQERYTM